MTERDAIIEKLVDLYPNLSPQLQKAAKFVIDTPTEVAINSMRHLSSVAGVGPSTMLRLANRLGFANYEDFRQHFQDAMRESTTSFAGRAEWLQSLKSSRGSGLVISGLVEAAIENIEKTFANAETAKLEDAAKILIKARTLYIFSSGSLRAIAEYFYSVCRLTRPRCNMIENRVGYPSDEIMECSKQDALLAISCEPYASISVETVKFAANNGAKIIALTDSRASPVAQYSDILIRTPTSSPHFFPSQVANLVMLEALLSLMVHKLDANAIKRIDSIERMRFERGIYWQNIDE